MLLVAEGITGKISKSDVEVNECEHNKHRTMTSKSNIDKNERGEKVKSDILYPNLTFIFLIVTSLI